MVAALAPRQVVVARVGGLRHESVEFRLGDRASSFVVDVGHAEGRRQGLGRVELAGRLEAEPGERAQVGVAGRVDEGSRAHAREAGPCRHDQVGDPAVADLGGLDERVQQGPGAGFGDQAFPDDLEVLGEVGHAGPRAVGVRSLQDRAELPKRGHDVVTDAADDLACRRPGRVEAVERVEDGGARAAEEGEAVDQQDRGAGTGRGDGGGRASRAGPDDADVDLGDDRGGGRGGHEAGSGSRSGSGDTEVTDQPPSTLSIWPVTARDSSDRKKTAAFATSSGSSISPASGCFRRA